MSWFGSPRHEMGRRLGKPDNADPMVLDDATAERLLRGTLSSDDAPPNYQKVTTMLTALTAGLDASELPGEGKAVESISRCIALNAASSPQTRRTTTTVKRRFRVAGVTLVGAATVLAGLGAAGALPGAAQRVASDMLNTVGVSVPNPDAHSIGHADHRGGSGDAADTAGARGTTAPQNAGKGDTTSDLARNTPSNGVDKGAAVSSSASDDQSRAGQDTPAGPPTDAPTAAPVETPNPGGTGTAGDASDGKSDAGTGASDGASDGRSADGSGNATDGLTLKP